MICNTDLKSRITKIATKTAWLILLKNINPLNDSVALI